jgi:hypothetical protein
MKSTTSSQNQPYTYGFPYYPTGRDDKFLPTPADWLSMKKRIDNVHQQDDQTTVDPAEANKRSLWRVHDKLYDLSNFSHPGGSAFIELSADTDITELFETSHHNIEKAKLLLSKYFVRDCHQNHRRYTEFFTFEEHGFYCTLRSKVSAILQQPSNRIHSYWSSSSFIHDSLLVTHICLLLWMVLMPVHVPNILAGFTTTLTGVFLGMLAVCGHNFFHKNDNWRMWSVDLALVSSYEWRISHVYSHHNYANSIYDYEIQAFEPLICFLPHPAKGHWPRQLLTIVSFAFVIPIITMLQVQCYDHQSAIVVSHCLLSLSLS